MRKETISKVLKIRKMYHDLMLQPNARYYPTISKIGKKFYLNEKTIEMMVYKRGVYKNINVDEEKTKHCSST